MLKTKYRDNDSVRVVDMESVLDYKTDMIDEAHPNLSGYKRMAAEWFNALRRYKVIQ
jgi:hypothetical protein